MRKVNAMAGGDIAYGKVLKGLDLVSEARFDSSGPA